ncbi:hypothetical protein IW261DRAFT_1554347 [Armillaria novae-zelandiae]|uniref:Uncharacterized protein n=1 Tax=Armillaria novae-zelandiae TaxID=153914 RepID=A0AA39N9J4_9AGAR|nr:hypothetical protein IW261DRAFT_1554347 [Armillaria novae-zelandiae]
MKMPKTIFCCQVCQYQTWSSPDMENHYSQTKCYTRLDEILARAEKCPKHKYNPALSNEPSSPESTYELAPIPTELHIFPNMDAGSSSALLPHKRTWIEDVEDEDNIPQCEYYIEDFPWPAGDLIIERGVMPLFFELLHCEKAEKDEVMWAPFHSREEWELVWWLMCSGISQKEMDTFLKLDTIKNNVSLSFNNRRKVFQTIDKLLMGPEWTCKVFELQGDLLDENKWPKIEEVELWKHDPVSCIQELMGDACFKKHMRYVPKHVYLDNEHHSRVYNEIASADWWWKVQKLLPKGIIVVPVIISSDKTQLSCFSGNNQAGNKGVKMLYADGQTRLVHPILAAYVTDYPEQCLVRCCIENRCPKCLAKADKLGDLKVSLPSSEGLDPEKFTNWRLCLVNLFWADLPYCDIFLCFTPDILHQLYKSAFKDHLVKWTTAAVNKLEVDHHFQAMMHHPSLQYFKKGVSLVFQWTHNKHKNMEKKKNILIGYCRAVLDFIYYAHYEEHTTESLQKLEEAWHTFHDHKAVFIEQGICKHFNIPKIHSMTHYASTIHSHGSAGYIKQMTAWMSRCEAVKKFQRFLQYFIDEYTDSEDWEDQKRDDKEEEEVEADNNNAYIDAPLTFGESVYSIPKVPAYTNITIDHLQIKFKASEFVYAMEAFLHEHKLLKPDYWDAMPAMYLVYKQFQVHIPPTPEVLQSVPINPICATLPEPSHNHRKAILAHFDTVLARKESMSSGPTRCVLCIIYPSSCLPVAQVCAIFDLLAELGYYPWPLAYVEWFMPLCNIDEVTGIAVIVPITYITCTCHLTPYFGCSITPHYTSNSVLDTCSTFHINLYLWHINFALLCDNCIIE